MLSPMIDAVANSTSLKLLVSLHDATPFHLARLKKAEVFFEELGLEKVTYLLVPEYHRSNRSSTSLEFIEWCRQSRSFSVQWHLHGYHHLEGAVNLESHSGGFKDGLKRKFMTGGEGEFLALNPEEMQSKLSLGKEVFKSCLGYDPVGFVAPAWLFNPGLLQALKYQGIRFTEDHGRLYDLDRDRILPSPVITWATRTLMRKYGSLVVCPLLEKLWATKPVLRVAMHPLDFDHPSTIKNIQGVLQRLLRKRSQVFCDDLNF